MAKTTTSKLDLSTREPAHSRAIRRLRRQGRVPGVLYGKGADPVVFDVDERELRHALAGSGAVLDLSIDGAKPEPAVVKEAQRHPVRGQLMHVDLLRVDLNVAIQSPVGITLVGGDEAPGVKEGGVLSSPISELHVEALPSDIPDTIEVDVSHMGSGDTLLLSAVTPPQGVTFLDDLEETVVATITVSSPVEEATEEVEAETGVVGEGEAPAAGEAEGGESAEAESGGGESSE